MTRIVLWWKCKIHFKKRLSLKPIRLSTHGRSASSALFILPNLPNILAIAEHLIKAAPVSTTSNLHPLFLYRQSISDNISPQIRRSIITYTQNDLDRWGIPNENMVKRLFSKPYEAVVDFNTEFNPISAYLTGRSGAPLRIGFVAENTDLYYNIILAQNSNMAIEKKYLRILKLLGL